MYLKDVLSGVNFRTKSDLPGIEVKGVKDDSRSVRSGDMFVAVKGYSLDGHKFIDDAVRKGAKVIVSEEIKDAPKTAAKILVDDARAALPIIAGNFYGHPSAKLKTIGVTGTNGKTTITYIIENIIKSAGKDTGVIGTINYRLGDRVLPAKNTTPGSLQLQSMLADMVKMGLGFAVMEVSSHSLDQGRVEGISFDVGIFTNITAEHLDYHKTIANYFKAKARLFDRLKEGGVAVLNIDDKKVAVLKKSIRKKVLTYGIGPKADVRAEGIKLSLDGSRFKVVMPEGGFNIHTRLVGRHNISNILAGIAASYALGIERPALIKGAAFLSFCVPGRLEEVDAGQPFKVLVDYAHTEDALYNILSLLSEVAGRRIITVFGCGGNRDRKKRPLMGKVACEFSHRAIITSDNPRFEDPRAIIDEIEKGVKGIFSNYDIAPDRRQAIEKALMLAEDGDIVVIAGKGHENYQIIKDKVIPFDDREVAREILGKARCL